jgi:hypothetical protein
MKSNRLERLNHLATKELWELAKSRFLNGECDAFAIALHRGLGWHLYALRTRDNPYRHVFVRSTPGECYDVRGSVPLTQISQGIGLEQNYSVVATTERDLIEVAKTQEGSIATALQMAQAMWPDLQWLPNTTLRKTEMFVVELEALLRKHGLGMCLPNMGVNLETLEDPGDTHYYFTPIRCGGKFSLRRKIDGVVRAG